MAFKLLHGSAGGERFAREAELLSELNHPGIVRYVASGLTAEGEPYLAMEWLEGETLSARFERGMLTVDQALEVGRLIAEALAVAHRRGIVHRDLKPGNVLLVGGALGRLKLLDFGIARAATMREELTETGAMLGTPGYMAPEQAKAAQRVDARADVYALGVVLFRALTGCRPFEGETALEVMLQALMEPAPRLATLRADAPPALDDLVARMLSKEPDEGPTDGDAVTRALQAIAEGREPETATSMPGPSASAAPVAEPSSKSAERFVPEPTAAAPPMSPAQPDTVAVAPATPVSHVSRRAVLALGAGAMVLAATALAVGLALRPAASAPASLVDASSSPATGDAAPSAALSVPAPSAALPATAAAAARSGRVLEIPCPYERCEPVTLADGKRFDFLEPVPAAERLARQAEPSAEFVMIFSGHMVEGYHDALGPEAAVYVFRYRTTAGGYRSLGFMLDFHMFMQVHRYEYADRPPLVLQRCGSAQAWKAALAHGFPAAPTAKMMLYQSQRGATVGQVDTMADDRRMLLDGDCRPYQE